MTKRSIYLDHAATTPLDPAVLQAMQPYLTDQFYNPSATYQAARQTRAAVESARAKVAHYIGARPSEIIFTAGGTEANNLAIHGVMSQFPGANMVISAIEHDSVRNPAQVYGARTAAVAQDGRLQLQALSQLIDEKTVLISLQYANNELGTVQSLSDVAQLVGTVRRDRQVSGNTLPLYLHTDACQAPAYLDIHASRLGVDLLTINASKIYGPKQTGALFVKKGIVLAPYMQGGGQERGLRSGTENVANCVGLAHALGLVQDRRRAEVARLRQLQKAWITSLKQSIPSVSVNGSLKHRLPNNLHITIPGADNERLVMALDDRGIMCAVGSACSASSDEPSHVLTAIGLTEHAAESSLRFTMGKDTTETDIQEVVTALVQILA